MKNNINKNIWQIINCVCFFAILILVPVVTLLSPKKSFLETENRSVHELSDLSAQNIMNRSFMKSFEDYFSDVIIGRDYFLKLKHDIDYLSGKFEIGGVYILKSRMVERIDEPDYASIDKSITAINKFADNNNIPVFFMLAPTSAGIYTDEIPPYAPSLNQKEFIEYVEKILSNNISIIDVYDNLFSARNEYIYYKTDHHWTTLCAYKAYAQAGKKMGYSPLPLQSYDIEHAGFDFRGTFYNRTLFDKTPSDTLNIFHSNTNINANLLVTEEIGSESIFYDSIYFREFLEQADKYSVFLGQNQPTLTITNGNPNGGGRLLIIKDSYAHCYAPFLIDHYSEITLLDLRYIQLDYNDVINIEDYDQVLILYNVSTFTTDINLRKLGV